MGKLFSQSAIEKISSPEQTDLTIRVTSIHGWLALLGIALVVGAGVVWGVKGSVPTKISGNGMLMTSGGVYSIVSPGSGRVHDIYLQPGDEVVAGQIVSRIIRTEAAMRLEASLANIADIQRRIAEAENSGSEQTELYRKSSEQQKLNLQKASAALNEQLKSLEERLESEQILLRDGLITKQQVFQTRQQIHQTKKEKAANLEALDKISVSLFENKNRLNEKKTELQLQLRAAELDVENQRQRMEETTRVISPYTGRVTEVSVEKNELVGEGVPIVLIELTGPEIKELEGVFFFPANQGKQLKPGMEAFLTPSVVKPTEYGYLRAIITSVSPYPVSRNAVESIFHNSETTAMMMRDGAPIEVHADLIPDPNTVSGFRWTSPDGPPFRLRPGTITAIDATIREQRPISLVLPFLKGLLLGIGE